AQHDVARQVRAMRRGLRAPAMTVRWGFSVLWALVLAWFAATMGHAIIVGTLPTAVTDALPMAADAPVMPLAFGLFAAGVMAVALVGYILAALALQVSRWRAA
ncbi:MAG: hypothetical protein AAFY39_06545, partial [Pseudomonadota bacterium]